MPKTDYAAHDARYQRLRAAGAPGWDTAADYLEREAELAWGLTELAVPGARVLDLGCGAGNIAAWLVDRGCDVTGIDISPTAIAWAAARDIARTRFVVGDVVAAIDRGDAGFDVVVDGHCLHCIIGADRARLLANVRGALVAGGHFFVSTMCGEVTGPKLLACFDPATRCQVVDGVAYRYIGAAGELLDELRGAGFAIERWRIQERADADDQDNLWAICRAA